MQKRNRKQLVLKNSSLKLQRIPKWPAYRASSAYSKLLDEHQMLSGRPNQNSRLQDYLRLLFDEAVVSQLVYTRTVALWADLVVRFGLALPLPTASPTLDGGILLTWDKGTDHRGLQISEDLFTLFLFDRVTSAANEVSFASDSPDEHLQQALEPILSTEPKPFRQVIVDDRYWVGKIA